MSKTIIFHNDRIDERGTCVSMYDYGHYNEVILNNKSIIMTKKSGDHVPEVIHKFSKRFKILYYNNESEIEELVKNYDIFYTITYGTKNINKVNVTNIKYCIHCVFDLSEPHGDVYAAVSKTLADKFNSPLYVPHMVGLMSSRTKENMRKELGIPEDAVVFGRHGGRDTFDLHIAKKAIVNAVNAFEHIYFIFVNTPVFYNHVRIIHLDKIIDLGEKNRFICSCDAMIHAQSLGETFGLCIGEFSVNNKPIICYNGKVWNGHYLNILKDKAFYYKTEDELYSILTTFNPKERPNKDWNQYKQYSPENVMKKFKEVFIDD